MDRERLDQLKRMSPPDAALAQTVIDLFQGNVANIARLRKLEAAHYIGGAPVQDIVYAVQALQDVFPDMTFNESANIAEAEIHAQQGASEVAAERGEKFTYFQAVIARAITLGERLPTEVTAEQIGSIALQSVGHLLPLEQDAP